MTLPTENLRRAVTVVTDGLLHPSNEEDIAGLGGAKQPTSDLSMQHPTALSIFADVRSTDDVIGFEGHRRQYHARTVPKLQGPHHHLRRTAHLRVGSSLERDRTSAERARPV